MTRSNLVKGLAWISLAIACWVPLFSVAKRTLPYLDAFALGSVRYVLGVALLVQLRGLAQAAPPEAIRLPAGTVAAMQQQQGVVGAVAAPLFDTYLVPFEITSLLLLAAVVGAVVLAKRKI